MGFEALNQAATSGHSSVSPLFWIAAVIWVGLILWSLMAAHTTASFWVTFAAQIGTVLLPVFTHRPLILGPLGTREWIINWIVVLFFAGVLAFVKMTDFERFPNLSKYDDAALEWFASFMGVAALVATAICCLADGGGRFPSILAHMVPLFGFVGLWLGGLEPDFAGTKEFDDAPGKMLVVRILGFVALLLS